MMEFTAGGKTWWVNPTHIVSITGDSGFATIRLSNGDVLQVDGPASQYINQLRSKLIK